MRTDYLIVNDLLEVAGFSAMHMLNIDADTAARLESIRAVGTSGFILGLILSEDYPKTAKGCTDKIIEAADQIMGGGPFRQRREVIYEVQRALNCILSGMTLLEAREYLINGSGPQA